MFEDDTSGWPRRYIIVGTIFTLIGTAVVSNGLQTKGFMPKNPVPYTGFDIPSSAVAAFVDSALDIKKEPPVIQSARWKIMDTRSS